LFGHGILDRTPEEVVDLYFRQCSILVTARDLAMIGACLANNGVNPVTGVVALQSRYVEKVLSVMSTCGMYDFSGGWIYNVGMPAKSGVGGGIMAVLPGQFGLGVFSPRLDAKGNSVRGIEACKRLSKDFSLHLFHVARSTSATVMRQVYDCAKRTSRRRRSEAELAVLAAQGHRIRVYELQGELLFGSAESVGVEILSELSVFDYLVIDLKRVIGTDRASILVLNELASRIATEKKHLFFTDCKNLYRFRKHLQTESIGTQEPSPLYFEDADHAVEWCENQLIAEAEMTGTEISVQDLGAQYLCSGMTSTELEELRASGEERTFPAGTCIFMAGNAAESMYFIFSGEVEVWIDSGSGHHLRLSTLGPGMVFGEVAFMNQKRRTANVSAATETQCLELRFESIRDALRMKMLMNMASHFASKIERDTRLIQQLG
jgi:glutaminase